MTKHELRPTTMGGIKRLAKRLSTSEALPHARALDQAARIAGFANYQAALRSLGKAGHVPIDHTIFVTACWNDRKAGKSGRETFPLPSPVPLDQLVSPAQMRLLRYLGGAHRAASDHLIFERNSDGQGKARELCCRGARELQFMIATGLKPSDARRIYPKGSFANLPPGHDHGTRWYDPRGKHHVISDEPYDRVEALIPEDRLVWADRFKWQVAKPRWAGIYRPDGGCCLFLAADQAKGPALDPIVSAIERSPPPVLSEPWTGVSAAYGDFFVSPAAALASAEPKPVKQRKPARARASIVYHMTFGGRRRRPNARMPVVQHKEVGRLLKSVLVGARERDGVRNRVDLVRSELDEWAMREYGRDELDDPTFFDLYYHKEDRSGSSLSKAELIAMLRRAKTILIAAYPSCPPLDAVLNKLDRANESLAGWRIDDRRAA